MYYQQSGSKLGPNHHILTEVRLKVWTNSEDPDAESQFLSAFHEAGTISIECKELVLLW